MKRLYIFFTSTLLILFHYLNKMFEKEKKINQKNGVSYLAENENEEWD